MPDYIAYMPGALPGERLELARFQKDTRLGITRVVIPSVRVGIREWTPLAIRPVGDLLIEVEGISMLFDGGQFDTSENRSIEPDSVGVGIFSDLVTLKRKGR